jgi:hypothetical protein
VQQLSDKYQTYFNPALASTGKVTEGTTKKFTIPGATPGMGGGTTVSGPFDLEKTSPRPSMMTSGGLALMARIGMAMREKVKDLLITDLTKAAKGNG